MDDSFDVFHSDINVWMDGDHWEDGFRLGPDNSLPPPPPLAMDVPSSSLEFPKSFLCSAHRDDLHDVVDDDGDDGLSSVVPCGGDSAQSLLHSPDVSSQHARYPPSPSLCGDGERSSSPPCVGGGSKSCASNAGNGGGRRHLSRSPGSILSMSSHADASAAPSSYSLGGGGGGGGGGNVGGEGGAVRSFDDEKPSFWPDSAIYTSINLEPTQYLCILSVSSFRSSLDQRPPLIRGIKSRVEIKPLPPGHIARRFDRDYGLYATKPLDVGTLIGEYVGIVSKECEVGDAPLSIVGGGMAIDATLAGNETRYLLQASQTIRPPNVKLYKVVDSGGQDHVVVSVYRRIEIGDEIVYSPTEPLGVWTHRWEEQQQQHQQRVSYEVPAKKELWSMLTEQGGLLQPRAQLMCSICPHGEHVAFVKSDGCVFDDQDIYLLEGWFAKHSGAIDPSLCGWHNVDPFVATNVLDSHREVVSSLDALWRRQCAIASADLHLQEPQGAMASITMSDAPPPPPSKSSSKRHGPSASSSTPLDSPSTSSATTTTTTTTTTTEERDGNKRRSAYVRTPWIDRLEALSRIREESGEVVLECKWSGDRKGEHNLGQWIASMRHKHKRGKLTHRQVEELTRAGIQWSGSKAKSDAVVPEPACKRRRAGSDGVHLFDISSAHRRRLPPLAGVDDDGSSAPGGGGGAPVLLSMMSHSSPSITPPTSSPSPPGDLPLSPPHVGVYAPGMSELSNANKPPSLWMDSSTTRPTALKADAPLLSPAMAYAGSRQQVAPLPSYSRPPAAAYRAIAPWPSSTVSSLYRHASLSSSMSGAPVGAGNARRFTASSLYHKAHHANPVPSRSTAVPPPASTTSAAYGGAVGVPVPGPQPLTASVAKIPPSVIPKSDATAT